MRLRHQLWLISLLLLALPWAGAQFVKETEAALLLAQQQTLRTTAQVIAMRLAEQPSYAGVTNPQPINDNKNQPIYFHALDEAPVLDGFDDDWLSYSQSPIEIYSSNSVADERATLYSGIYRQDYYLLLSVPDDSLNPLNPAVDPLTSGDHLLLSRENQPLLYLSASAPGNISARFLDGGSKVRPEYGVAAVWNYLGDRYVIEIRIRARLLDRSLGLDFVRRDSANDDQISRFSIGVTGANADVAPFVAAKPEMAKQLEGFTSPGLRLSVLDSAGWLQAQSGGFADVSAASNQHGAVRALYKFILRDKDIEPLIDWPKLGKLGSPERLSSAIFGDGAVKISQTVVPISLDDQHLGYVVAEQTSDSLTTTTNHAFNRLLFWTLIAMLVAVTGLLLFSVWLSFRIRKLSKAADEALDDRGNLTRDFPVSKVADEIGDLSQSYQRLLNRLNEYTDYLKTLSGKLSHELKTPLAVVRTSLDNLDQQPLPEESKVYLERASDGAARLSAIFSALSGASRIEGIIKDAEYEPVDIAGLLQTLFESYQDAYPNAKISFSAAQNNSRLDVNASAELIVQMLDKLVDNAVGFCTENGSVELRLESEDETVILSVVNDGPLLHEGMKTQLFDSMVSVRDSGHRESGQLNLGLGLYIARLIAEGHGGRLTLDNLADRSGVIARVSLPICPEGSQYD